MIMLGFHFNLPVIFIYCNVLLFAESPVGFCIIKINLSLPPYGVIVSRNKNIPRLLSRIHPVEQNCTWLIISFDT